MASTRIWPLILLFSVTDTDAQSPRLMLPFTHTNGIKLAKFSPDARLLATMAESEKAVFICEANTGKLLQTIRGGDNEIYYFDFGPDGRNIITYGKDNTVIAWDIYTGNVRVVLKGHTKNIRRAHYSRDGKKIVTASGDQTIKIWDAGSGKVLLTLKGHGGPVQDAYFTKSGKRIVSMGWDSTVRIWNPSNGALVRTFSKPKTHISDFTVSDDEKKIFIIYGNSIMLYDLAGNRILFDKDENTNGFGDCRFSPDNQRIIIHAWQWFYVTIRDAQTGTELRKFSGRNHPSAVFSIAVTPSGDKVFVPDADGKGFIWDVVNDKEYAVLDRKVSEVSVSFFSTDGTKLTTISNDSKYYRATNGMVWNARNGSLLSVLKGNISQTGKAAWIGDKPLVVTGIDTAFYLWDTKTGNPISSFRHKILKLHGQEMQLSTDGTKLLSTLSGDPIVLDLFTGKLFPSIYVRNSKYLIFLGFSPDGNKVVTIHDDKVARLWDAGTGKMLYELTEKFAGITVGIGKVCFTPDGEKIVTGSQNGFGKVWNTKTGKPLVSFRTSNISEPNNVSVDPSGNKIIISDYGGATIVDIHSGKVLAEYKEQADDYFHQVNAAFSPDNIRVATLDSRLIIWDTLFIKSQLIIREVPGMYYFTFSPDSRKIVTYGENNFARIWDIVQGKMLFELKGHENNIKSLFYNKQGNRIISSSGDNTFKLWDATSGKLLYTFFPLGENGYINLIPSGFYKTSADAARLLYYVTKDLKIITFEQLDVKYNRPDKVLEAIGNTDKALISSYRKAWEKRIKKLGIDTTAFRDGYSVPEADFVNRDAIEYEQQNGTLNLHIKGIDSTYKLDRFNVWVNESPIFGQRGISIKKKNSNRLDTTLTIKLSQGENRIETSITNVNGTESYRMPLYVKYTPAVKQKESLKFIGIGIEKFADSSHNLSYSVKDIRDLSAKLKEKYGSDITIDTLFNENVNTAAIKSLKQRLQQTTVNDKVIVAYSGHGLLSRDFDYFLSTYSVRFDKPEENGLPYDELENLLDSIPARKKLMLIDACHSGEVDKEEMVRINETSDSMGLMKGTIPVALKPNQSHLGMKNSFELMQSLFVNVGKSTGATVISAAAGTQFALERGDLKNGVFTYSILEVMNKYPTMKISELKKTVGERVEQLTNGLQKPTSRNETIAVDWNLW